MTAPNNSVKKDRWTDLPALRQVAIERYGTGDPACIHGITHWKKVEKHGLWIAEESRADRLVVQLFAWFHDACRINDHKDDGHGKRAAEFAASQRGIVFDLDDIAFTLLSDACIGHTDGQTTTDATIGACWDADRLDLGRVGLLPQGRFMSTGRGREKCYMV